MNLKQVALNVLPQPVIHWHYQRQIEQSTIHDEPDIACLPGLIRPDFICIDIGANIGRYTKHLSRLSSHVAAVEPTPFTAAVLRNTVRALELSNVQVHQCALSDFHGTGTMKIPNIYEAELTEGSDVSVRTLDELCAHLPRVDFIKCDTEGHEVKVVKGAQSVITKFRPMWLIETNWDSPLFALMERLGYQCFVEDKGSIRPRQGQEKKTNYFFKDKSSQ
jgi:FkbM family methyltransferase